MHLIRTESTLDEENKKKITEEELKKCETQCQDKLTKLYTTHTELSGEKKALERKFANIETRQLEITSERDKIRGKITEVDGDIAKFLQDFGELYNHEINVTLDLHAKADGYIAEMVARLNDDAAQE